MQNYIVIILYNLSSLFSTGLEKFRKFFLKAKLRRNRQTLAHDTQALTNTKQNNGWYTQSKQL